MPSHDASPRARERKPVPLAMWILALTAVPILAASGWALLAVSSHPANLGERAAVEDLARVAPVIERALEERGERVERLGQVIARDPKFFAVLTLPRTDRGTSEFKTALEGVLRDFQRDANTPLFLVCDERGNVLARASASGGSAGLGKQPFVRQAAQGRAGRGYVVERGRIFRVAAVPVTAGGVLVGILCLGEEVDGDFAGWIRNATGCDLVFAAGEAIASTTLPPSPLRKEIANRLKTAAPRSADERAETLDIGGTRYLAVARALGDPASAGPTSPSYLLLRPLEPETSPLARLREDLVRAMGLGFLLALVCGGIAALAARRMAQRERGAARGSVERLEEMARCRSELLAGASDEVLEPASTITTMTELITGGALGDLSPPQLEGILAIRRASDSLARVGQDLANLSLLDPGSFRLKPERVDVGGLVERSAIQAISLATERRQTVSLSIEPALEHPAVDALLLTRAVQNLATHAVRSSPEEGKIQLGARRSETGILIQVVSSGADPVNRATLDGAPPADRDALALAVAARIAAGHGGALRLWSEPGAGNTFTLEIPYSRTSAGPRLDDRAEELPLAS